MDSRFLDKLAQLRSSSCDQLPTPELAVLARAIARLRRSSILQKCLQTGETVTDFHIEDEKNRTLSFYEVLEKGPVVINFFRGFWCRFCQTELEAYENIQDKLQELGCQYLAISPQKHPEDSPVSGNYKAIFDRNNDIAKKFGIVYTLNEEEIALFSEWGLLLDKINESEIWELPLPATYVISTDRTVSFQYVDVDFRSRCCPEQLLEVLEKVT